MKKLRLFSVVLASCAAFGLLHCEKHAIAPPLQDSETLSEIKGPVNIQGFDSYSDDSRVHLYWTTGRPFIDFPGTPLPRRVYKVKVFLSETDPENGFRKIFERDKDGQDSTVVSGLSNGQLYYFRLATYDSAGMLLGVSRPLMTTPDIAEQPLISITADPADHPLYVSNLSWSPDGRWLAYIHAPGRLKPNIYVLDTQSMTTRQITRYDDNFHRLLAVTWAPDGRRLAYCYTASNSFASIDYRIWITFLDQNSPQSVTSGRVDCDPAWGANENIFFTRGTYEPPNIPEIFKVNLSQPDLEVPLTNDQQTRKYSLAVRPAGDLIVYSGESLISYKRFLYTLSTSGGASIPITENPYWQDIQPSWSPDGNVMVFSSDRCGHYEAWTLDLRTNIVKQLTHGLNRNLRRFHAKYAPDGSRLAVLEYHVDHRATISILPAQRFSL